APWACPTTWRSPYRRARRWCGSAAPFSGPGGRCDCAYLSAFRDTRRGKLSFRAAKRGAWMATVWRRAMTYLGLGPDEEYDDYDEVEPIRDHVPERPMRPGMNPGPRSGGTMRSREPEYEPSDVSYVGGVRRLQPQPVDPSPGI